MGAHAALLYHVSSAVQAFHNDLQAQGLGDKVVTATVSEFGRRIPSNGSYGTDHGNAAPLFVFGNCVNAGVYGTNPTFTDLQEGNLPMQIDYPQVMTALVMDWLGADVGAMQHVAFTEWVDSRLDIIRCKWPDVPTYTQDTGVSISPNPTSHHAVLSCRIEESDTYLLRIDSGGGRNGGETFLGLPDAGKKTWEIDTAG